MYRSNSRPIQVDYRNFNCLHVIHIQEAALIDIRIYSHHCVKIFYSDVDFFSDVSSLVDLGRIPFGYGNLLKFAVEILYEILVWFD